MKVLLRDDVDKLGALGEIIDVADGFARNFLLPQNLAVRATQANEALIRKIRKQRAELESARRRKYEAEAGELRGKSTTIIAKVNEERKLYGSVDAAHVAEAILRDIGHDTEPKNVLIDEPIKELGTFDIEIRLYPDVTTSIKLYVVADE
jgi:large subunit ribosomal protein L9